MGKICYLDMDGVLTNFVKAACELHNAEYPYPKHNGVWHFNDILRLEEKEFYRGMGFEFWTNLEWLPDGCELLEIVENYFHEIHLLTSPCLTQGCKEGKIEWVKKHLPRYNDKLIIDSRKQLYAGRNKLLIDDGEHNVEKFLMAGGEAILLARPWNKYHHITNAVQYLKTVLRQMI